VHASLFVSLHINCIIIIIHPDLVQSTLELTAEVADLLARLTTLEMENAELRVRLSEEDAKVCLSVDLSVSQSVCLQRTSTPSPILMVPQPSSTQSVSVAAEEPAQIVALPSGGHESTI
jgi:hypothetical protein